MKRRSFFKSLAQAAAIVALAPQLAFRVKPAPPLFDDLDTEYRCILMRPTKTHSLVSTTFTAIWADPNTHITIENFSE